MEEDDSLFKSFATSTTAHGFSRLAEAQNLVRKVIWSVLLVAAFVAVVTVLGFRLSTFLEFKTIIESDRRVMDWLEFPSVTICNHNQLSMKKLMWRAMKDGVGLRVVPNASGGEMYENPMLEYYNSLCESAVCAGSDILCAMGDNGDCCLSSDRVCDGYIDCMDERDEGLFCSGPSTLNPTNGPWIVGRSGSGQSTTVSTPASSTANRTDLSSMLMEDGWHLTDKNIADHDNPITLLECKFAGVACDTAWFRHLLTDKGACYTFNHPQNSLPDGVDKPLRQSNGGPAYGLRLVLDAQVADYVTSVYTNMLKGLTISVHGNDVKPNMKDTGMNVPVGFHTNIAISQSQMINIERPWGKCDQNDKLELLPNMTYSYQSCTQECMAKEVIRACRCKPYYTGTEDDSIGSCDQDTWTICGLPTQDATIASFSSVCSYCNPACNETTYETKISQSQIVSSESDTAALNSKYYKQDMDGYHTTENFYSESVVSMAIYFENLQLTTVSQKKQIDELGLISEFGGMLGLFMGLSLLTLVEILETIVMGCYKCHLRRSYGASSTRVLPLSTQDHIS